VYFACLFVMICAFTGASCAADRASRGFGRALHCAAAVGGWGGVCTVGTKCCGAVVYRSCFRNSIGGVCRTEPLLSLRDMASTECVLCVIAVRV